MTEHWVFSENEILGGSSEGSTEDVGELSERVLGGVSVSKFFCKTKPSADSANYTFFENFAVPFGLFHSKCDSFEGETNDDENSLCENFDRIFDLSARNLAKGNRTTRKKINK